MLFETRSDDLISRHFEGSLSPAEREELEEILRRDPAARDRLAEAAHNELLLSELAGRGIPEPLPLSRPRRLDPGSIGLAAAALVAICFGLLALLARPQPAGRDLARVRAGRVFELLGDGRQVPAKLLVCSPARTFRAHPGAVLDLAGTRVSVREQARFTLAPPPGGIGSRRPLLDLRAGRILVETSPGGAGLRVRTPAGMLNDIGTRFEVHLNPDRETTPMLATARSTLAPFVSVLVLAGLVQFQPQDAPRSAQVLGPAQGEVSLRADGSLGKALDREGLAQCRHRGEPRWHLLRAEDRLQPGDLVRTGKRGANAAALRLANQARLTLGPGAQIEIVELGKLRLLAGELALHLPKGIELRVEGARGQGLAIEGAAFLRAGAAAPQRLEQRPRWLVGYEEDRSTEALGSLLAQVDGRNVPLTMGYHKVTVDIRDQIARTVVEESFINHSDQTLEGVFTFPLPPGASISGFAMWIGDQKVPGEIVEKQRAREIYETILREKRDPGLLEWSGGNLFKARVYPIHSEKRIEITYTEVLPKVGTDYRYSYALRSDLTRLAPLERLEIGVTISSAERIAGLECPTHACRIERGDHAARATFSAEEIVPQRDFELRVSTARDASPVRFLPHRRGKDGYFLLLFDAPQPPAGAAEPAAAPRDYLFLLDTSGSMAGAPRAAQRAALEALLAGLGPRDRLQLATVDGRVRWAFDGPRASTPTSREKAQEFFEQRTALGWSNLAAAFEQAFERSSEETQIIYLGDGIVTAGRRDPAALVARLQRAHAGRGSVHTVALGSSSEPAVMRGLARLGEGTSRVLGAGEDAAELAEDLLGAIRAPGVRALSVEFAGIDVAAVHPAHLPNLAAGTQAVVVGRYDPTQEASGAEVRVSGTFRGEPLSYRAPIDLGADERGNSFTPRLWARRELDHLLEQGGAAARERIIALSENFQIITPYTSFLVLESEADRERFQVKRRLRMRDGEEFFAKGRGDASFELRREQMRLAHLWRRGLRDRFLKAIEELGRERMALFAPTPPGGPRGADVYHLGFAYGDVRSRTERYYGRPMGGVPSGLERGGYLNDFDLEMAQGASIADPLAPAANPALADLPVLDALFDKRTNLHLGVMGGNRYAGLNGDEGGDFFFNDDSVRMLPPRSADGYLPGRGLSPLARGLGIFPAIGAAAAAPAAAPPWPPEVLAAVARLDRRNQIAAQAGGMRIRVELTRSDYRGRPRGTWLSEHLLGPHSWWTITPHRTDEGERRAWCAGGERGVLVTTWMLGRRRAARPSDAGAWDAPFYAWFTDLARAYPRHAPALEEAPEGAKKLVLSPTDPGGLRIEILFDPARAAILEVRQLRAGELVKKTLFEELHQVGATWWPRRVRVFDEQERPIEESRLEIEELDAAALAQLIDARRRLPSAALVLGELPTDLRAARQAVRDGKARLEDRWALIAAAAARQLWKSAAPHIESIGELARGKLGRERLLLSLAHLRRRDEEAHQLARTMAAALAAAPPDGERAAERQRALELYQIAAAFLAPGEKLELLEMLRPVHARQQRPEPLRAIDDQLLRVIGSLGRPRERLALLAELIERYPLAPTYHIAYARALAARGEVDQGLAHIGAVLEKHAPWSLEEARALRQCALGLLLDARRLDEAVRYLERWQELAPEQLTSDLLERHLSALTMLGRVERADALLARWLQDGLVAAPRGIVLARLKAAIEHALGRGWNMTRTRFEERWEQPLAKAARFLASHPLQSGLAERIITNRSFGRTRSGAALRAELFATLREGLEGLTPRQAAEQIRWLKSCGYQPADGENPWREICAALLERWVRSGEEDPGGLVQAAVEACGSAEQKLRYRRQRVAVARGEGARAQARQARQALFNALLNAPWSAAIEGELLALIPHLRAVQVVPPERREEADRAAALYALYRFVGLTPARRAQAELAARPDFTKLTRRALKAAREEATRRARRALAQRLGAAEKELAASPLAPWLRIERIYLLAKAGEPSAALREQAWATLREALARAPEPGAAEPTRSARELVRRCLATLAWFALIAPDGAECADELLAFLEERSATPGGILAARRWRAELLLGLDRIAPLAAALRTWYGAGDRYEQMPWGRMLAYLRAESGELGEAIALFDAIEPFEELRAADYRALAGWLTAQGAREREAAARRRSWEVQSEGQLVRWLDGQYGRISRSGADIPAELDPQTPVVLSIMLRKSSAPAQRLWYPRWFYRTTRDFRLLPCLATGILGHSAQAVYAYLGQVHQILDLLQEEATLDRLAGAIAALRADQLSTSDRRALALLEFLARQRAAHQAQGTSDHVAAARAALRAAWKGTWEEGEAPAMAGFLAGLGKLADATLAEEVLEELAALQSAAPRGSDERLTIAFKRAAALWSNARREDAVRVGAAALAEVRSSASGLLPENAFGHLAAQARRLRLLGRGRAGEQVLLAELGRHYNEARRRWLELQVLGHDAAVLKQGGATSLGAGEELYRALEKRYDEALARRSDEEHIYALVEKRCELWRQIHDGPDYQGMVPRALDFAFSKLPPILARTFHRGSQPTVYTVARCLHEIAGARLAIEFLIARAENEPAWLRLANSDFWSYNAWLLGKYFQQVSGLGSDLERRLLAIVLAELRADLRSNRARSRYLYSKSSYFWKARRSAFAQVAREVLAERSGSETSVRYIARYLHDDLGASATAIEALRAAYRTGILGLDGRQQLCEYLHGARRWAESIPILDEMIAARPARLVYRTLAMRACFHAGRRARLAEIAAAADAYFHADNRWTETVMAALGQACLDTMLYERSIGYHREAIALHTRGKIDRGVGQGTLGPYYRNLAAALSALGRTAEAIQACSGAILAWGRGQRERQRSLEQLEKIFAQARDLEAWERSFEAELEREGMENPILRGALGQFFLSKGRPERAIHHLSRAVAARPEDLELQRRLIAAYDAAGKPEEAARQLLAQARAAASSLELYRKLGDRWQRVGQSESAERAYTSIVEARPDEARSHQLLAEVRERQERLRAALAQWREVDAIRSGEPAGLHGMLRNLIRLREWDQAREVLGRLRAHPWPERFDKLLADLPELARSIPDKDR